MGSAQAAVYFEALISIINSLESQIVNELNKKLGHFTFRKQKAKIKEKINQSITTKDITC